MTYIEAVTELSGDVNHLNHWVDAVKTSLDSHLHVIDKNESSLIGLSVLSNFDIDEAFEGRRFPEFLDAIILDCETLGIPSPATIFAIKRSTDGLQREKVGILPGDRLEMARSVLGSHSYRHSLAIRNGSSLSVSPKWE